MNINFSDILREVDRAELLYPVWPAPLHRGDHVWAASILCEEAGEVLKAALNWQAHERGSIADIREEAIQTAAMAIRFLINLDAVERQRINELARQELQEEHGLNAHIWQSEEPGQYRITTGDTGNAPRTTTIPADWSSERAVYSADDAGEWVRV